MQTLSEKLTSRKFWLSLAAAIAAFGTGVQCLADGNEAVAAICIVAAALSAAIYAGCEAACDIKSMEGTTRVSVAQAYAAEERSAANGQTTDD